SPVLPVFRDMIMGQGILLLLKYVPIRNWRWPHGICRRYHQPGYPELFLLRSLGNPCFIAAYAGTGIFFPVLSGIRNSDRTWLSYCDKGRMGMVFKRRRVAPLRRG